MLHSLPTRSFEPGKKVTVLIYYNIGQKSKKISAIGWAF
jgi:hypothetical protein